MSEFRIDQITNQAGTAGPQIAGITTFNSPSGLVMPSGSTFRRYVTENIVSDGLLLYLDAGNTVSYPGSGTIWRDLSGNNNHGTLTNGPTYSSANGGSIVFDSEDDYVNVPYFPALPTGSAPRTVSIWFYSNDSTWVNDINAIFHYGTTGNTRVAFGLDFYADYPKFQVFTWSDDLNYQSKLNKVGWNNITITYDGNLTLSAYDNGSFTTSYTLGGVLNTTSNTGVTIGGIPTLSVYYDGRISNVSIYNKALTPQEIQQNFNALRHRYGV